MPSTNTITVTCDMCCEEMNPVGANGWACWICKNFIPDEHLYRYAEHITIEKNQEAESEN